MPVLDHEIHPSTIADASHRYGCNGLPKALNHRMSDRCRYDRSMSDSSCTGCPHRGGGEDYAKSVRQSAAQGDATMGGAA